MWDLDVYTQPLLRDLRERERIWGGEDKEPGCVKWTLALPGCVPGLAEATGVPFEIYRFSHGILPQGAGYWGRKVQKGKGWTEWQGRRPTHVTHMACKCNVRRVRPRIPLPVRP